MVHETPVPAHDVVAFCRAHEEVAGEHRRPCVHEPRVNLTYDTRDGVVLIVSGEPDAIHYAHLERDTPHPGPMHPDTEERIR